MGETVFVTFHGQRDRWSAAAEVDHRDDGGGVVAAIAAVVDEADLAVEPFELAVGWAEVDEVASTLAFRPCSLSYGATISACPVRPSLEEQTFEPR